MRRIEQTLIALLLAIAGNAVAQNYPVKPVRMVVPYAAGGTYDIYARVLGQKLTEVWGQPLVIENRVGANAIIGTDLVAKSAPDGYTLLMATVSTHAINPGLYKSMPYDPVKDFAPVAQVGVTPCVLAVNPALPVTDVQGLIALAKSKPGQLSFSSAGSGSSQHLSAELLKSLLGLKMTHVPYKGGAPGAAAVVAGDVSLMFASASDALKFVGAGRVRALAVTGEKRVSALPDVPTMIEAGVPGFVADAWFGVLAPAATPPDIVSKLNSDIGNALKVPEVAERISLQGSAVIIGGSSEQFGVFIRSEIAKWSAVVKSSGAKVD